MIPSSASSTDPALTPAEPRGRIWSLLRRVALVGAAALSVALAVYIALVHPPSSYDTLALIAIGAAILASALVLWRSFYPSSATAATPPLPVAYVAPHPHVDSAFVCAKCAEYTPAPDWDAMLREIEAPRDLEGHGEEKPAITPIAAHSDPIWPRWQPATAVLSPSERPAPMAAAAFAPGNWASAIPGPEQEPEQIYSEAEISPVPAAVGGIALSGGHMAEAGAPVVRYSSPLALLGPDADAAAEVPPTAQSGGYPSVPLGTAMPLDRWISDESAGLVAMSVHMTAPDAPQGPAAPEGSVPGRSPHLPRCASCRGPVVRSAGTPNCTDCQQPICDDCRGSAVKHRDGSYCTSCAASRVDAELLRMLEDPIPVPTADEPVSDDLGVPPAHPGGRQAAERTSHPAPRAGKAPARHRTASSARAR